MENNVNKGVLKVNISVKLLLHWNVRIVKLIA
jgi:hypothetical protein